MSSNILLEKRAESIFNLKRSDFSFDSEFWYQVTKKLISYNFSTEEELLSCMRLFKSVLDWSYLSVNYSFLEKNLEEFFHLIDWEIACRYQILTESFIRKYWNSLPHTEVIDFQALSENFILEYFDELTDSISDLFTNQCISSNLLDIIYSDEKKRNKIFWNAISTYTVLTPEQLINYKNELIPSLIFYFQPNINDDIIKEYSKSRLPEEEINRMLDKNLFYQQRKRIGYRDYYYGYFFRTERHVHINMDGYIPIRLSDINNYYYPYKLIKAKVFYKDFIRTDFVKKIDIISDKEGNFWKK